MSQTQTLLDVCKALANQIWNAAKDDPKTKTFIASVDQITFSSPKAAEAEGKKLSLLPYSLVPDQTQRNIPAVGADGKRTIQATYAARFLVTPCTGKAETDLALLGKIIQTFLTSPVLTSETSGSTLTATQDVLSLTELTSLWTALAEPLKPSVSYSVTPVILGISAQQATQAAPIVAHSQNVMALYQTVLKTFSEQSDSWKHRNMLQKQYIIMDFNKNTDMTIEEMLNELKILGQKLETNQPTEPCLEALKRLEAYYAHQQEMLSGFEKVQKKRKEGIDMIAQWKNEVKALIDALSK